MDTIEHKVAEKRFVVNFEGAEAVLHYTLSEGQKVGSPTIIDFTSTFVPPQCRGKGLAEKLVRAGITWAKEQGYQLQASCWYAEKFIR